MGQVRTKKHTQAIYGATVLQGNIQFLMPLPLIGYFGCSFHHCDFIFRQATQVIDEAVVFVDDGATGPVPADLLVKLCIVDAN